MSVDGIAEFVARGVAAQNAADRAAGRLTAAEQDREDLIALLRARVYRELVEAIELTRKAASTLNELTSDAIYDVEFTEGTGRDVEYFIDSARRSLTAAHAQAIPLSREGPGQTVGQPG